MRVITRNSDECTTKDLIVPADLLERHPDRRAPFRFAYYGDLLPDEFDTNACAFVTFTILEDPNEPGCITGATLDFVGRDHQGKEIERLVNAIYDRTTGQITDFTIENVK